MSGQRSSSILAVIPARGGSKGIPRKNLYPLLGKPLVVWSIEAAKRSALIDRFVVSTEDAEISQICRDAGAEVLQRPVELASDDATSVVVLQHAIQEIPCKVVVLLQPTSPIRYDIDAAISIFLSGFDTLATGYGSTHREWTGKHKPRQEIRPYFHDDGNLYIFKAEVIKAGKWMGDNPCRLKVPQIYNFEIDTIEDVWAIEGVMRHCE